MFEAILPAVIGAVGSLLGGQQRNEAQASEAERANTFSAEQYAKRYQTTVSDMQAAGLNPMLAYSQGPGNAPTGQQAQMSDAITPAVQEGLRGYSAGSAVTLQKAQVENTKADTAKKEAEADNVRADTNLKSNYEPELKTSSTQSNFASAGQAQAMTKQANAATDKIIAEIKNVPLQGKVFERQAEQLYQLGNKLFQEQLVLGQQYLTEQAKQAQMRAMAQKALAETGLVNAEQAAIDKFDNLGRDAGQLKPVFDLLRGFLRR